MQAMKIIGGLLDRIVLLLGVLLGGCLPSFVNQYRQRVGGRLDQVLQDLAPFQEIANRYHGGSLEALIQHHLRSPDRTFYEEGAAIQAMVDAAERLRAALAALDTDIWHQLAYLAQHHDPDIVQATLQAYEPAFLFTVDSLMVAAVVGLTLWLLFVLLWRLLMLFSR
jgi:hypothetical protein